MTAAVVCLPWLWPHGSLWRALGGATELVWACTSHASPCLVHSVHPSLGIIQYLCLNCNFIFMDLPAHIVCNTQKLCIQLMQSLYLCLCQERTTKLRLSFFHPNSYQLHFLLSLTNLSLFFSQFHLISLVYADDGFCKKINVNRTVTLLRSLP